MTTTLVMSLVYGLGIAIALSFSLAATIGVRTWNYTESEVNSIRSGLVLGSRIGYVCGCISTALIFVCLDGLLDLIFGG